MCVLIEFFFSIIIEPLLWSLFTFFGFMIIMDLVDRVASKTKLYVITLSVIVFFIVAMDDIMNLSFWYR